jgi:hypothetical protein
MSIESEMQTLVQRKFSGQSQPFSNTLSKITLGVVCWVALIAVTNQGNMVPPLVNAIMCLPMLVADFRQHHNKLAIAVLNGTLVALVVTVGYSEFGGVLMFGLVFILSSIGWFVALIWSCLRVQKWEK